jgi:hypothetical protein
MFPAQQRLSMLHQLSDRMMTIPNPFLQLRSNQCRGLCLIQLKASRETFLGEEASL